MARVAEADRVLLQGATAAEMVSTIAELLTEAQMDSMHQSADAAHSPAHTEPRQPKDIPDAGKTQVIKLRDGDVFRLFAGMIRKRIGDSTVEMLAYNSSIPGPTLRVEQGSKITVDFTNEMDRETTVHWHGIRVDNRYDGVPYDIQTPVLTERSFSYHLRFPDAGIYWYHPHMYEDYAQELGLYGNILILPSDPGFWSPVNREFVLMLDDIMMEHGQIAPFDHSGMERFGNVMLMNGENDGRLNVNRGEVVRLYLTNAANARNFNIRIPGARIKLVGGDSGRVEHEQFIQELLLSPSERAVFDVLFESSGEFPLEHRAKSRSYGFGTIVVSDQPAEPSFAVEFGKLREDKELAAERVRLDADFERPPDKTLVLRGDMASLDQAMHMEHNGQMGMDHAMPSTGQTVWKLIDLDTGAVNHDIHWIFREGERVKIRLVNDAQSAHAMAHPVHFHGQRFLVLTRDGARNDNLIWKDTVLVNVGETVDILLDASNPGLWMAHCHIAEHAEGGMMFNFQVK
jgi:FtsP/CotA-like multicopper oxidase with cupredoxin domain